MEANIATLKRPSSACYERGVCFFVNIFSAWRAANKNIKRANWWRIYCCWFFSRAKPVITEKPLEVQAQFRLVKGIRAPLLGCVLSSRCRAQPQNAPANSIIGLSLLRAPHFPVGSSGLRPGSKLWVHTRHLAQAQRGLVPPPAQHSTMLRAPDSSHNGRPLRLRVPQLGRSPGRI